jgi:hypothetical protein
MTKLIYARRVQEDQQVAPAALVDQPDRSRSAARWLDGSGMISVILSSSGGR